MVTIKLYNNTSDNKDVDKSITLISTVTGNFKGTVDILNPVFDLELSELPSVNYCYIEEFNRYYYIDNISAITDKLFRFNCHVDVLMTYQDQIKNCTGIVGSQEVTNNLYLNDGTFKVYQNSQINKVKFSGSFSGTSLVLSVAGG